MVASIKTEIVRDDNGQFVGLWLMGDFASEHERGLEGLYHKLNINSDLDGIQGRTIGVINTTQVIFGKKGTYFCGGGFIDSDNVDWLDGSSALHPTYLDDDSGEYTNLTSAWTDDIFCIFAKDDASKDIIEELYHAAKHQDLAFWIGGEGGFMSRRGLAIAIASRIPDSFKEQLIAFDQQQKA